MLNAEAITAAITAYTESKGFSYRKLIGQGYDGASPFSGKDSDQPLESVFILQAEKLKEIQALPELKQSQEAHVGCPMSSVVYQSHSEGVSSLNSDSSTAL